MQYKGRIFVETMLVICWLAGPLTVRAEDVSCEDPWPPVGQDDAWVNNQIAVDHTVPPPWTPVNVEGSCIRVWGRETDFEGQALPAQIITQQTPVLVDRIGLLIQTKEMDTLTPMAGGNGKIVEKHPDKIVWQGLTETEGVVVETTVTIEFDGFTWLTLRVKPDATVRLKRLALEFPIREDIARYYHKKMEGYSPLLIKDMWGRVEGRSLKLQDFSLVNEDIGLSFFAEGRTGWMQDRTDRQVEWIVEDGQVKVRFNLIDLFDARAIEEERIISLGWNPMPVKPMREDWRRYFVFGCGDAPDSYKRWGETGMTPIFIKLTYHRPETPENLRKWCAEAASKDGLAYCPWGGNPKPYNIAGFNRYAARLREVCPGSRVTIYTVGTEHTALDPVVFNHQEEWSQTATRFTADDIAKGRAMRGECPCKLFVCGRSSFPDYKVWFMDDLFKKLDIDGYYYDNQIFRSCQNPAHADHLIPDEIYPLLATREMYKRIYKTLRKQKTDTMIVGHEAAPAYPFVDIAIGLEALLKLTGENAFYTSFMTPDDCRGSFFRGHQRGIPFLWLPEYRGKLVSGPESIRSTRAMLSLLWLCDTQYWVAWSNFSVLRQDLDIRGRFKIWEAQCLPFWRQEVVSSDQEEVKIAVYRKPRASLLFISNPGKKAHPNVTLSINTGDGLFEPGTDLRNLDIRDAETGHAITGKRWLSEDKTFYDFSVAIPDQDYRIIVIGSPDAVNESVLPPLSKDELQAINDRRSQWLENNEDSTASAGVEKVIARPLQGKIEIDGRLDEDAWKHANRYSEFRRYQDKKHPAQYQTTLRLLYDQTTLYFAAEIDMPDQISNPSNLKQTTEEQVLQTDCLEWYLGADGQKDYYWLAMNVLGFKAEAHFGSADDNPFDWNGRWKGAVERSKNRWIIEAAIPFAELALPSPLEEAEWNMNVARTLETDKGRVYSVLNHTNAGFHCLDTKLIFEKSN
ncbi:MAG: hypothetical protein GX629_04005 [Phycisphaerae bacterium]|nr:hypothetical protein [Phycisphaerae bacterium]